MPSFEKVKKTKTTMEKIKLTIDLEIGSNTYQRTRKDLELMAIDLITEYLSYRKECQNCDEERFDQENGYIIGDFNVNIT